MVGYTYSFGAGNYDIYIAKLDSAGNLQWFKTIGGSNIDVAFSIKQTTDGGYIIAGYTESFGAGKADVYICKLNSAGNFQWNVKIGSIENDAANSVIQTIDGGYAIAGVINSPAVMLGDLYILKLDFNGNFQWNKIIGGTLLEYASSIFQTTDGGYIAAGQTNSFGAGTHDMYVVKLVNNGNIQWNRTIGGIGGEYAILYCKQRKVDMP